MKITITPVPDKPMTDKQRKALSLLILDESRRINAEILKSGKIGFIK